MARSPRVPSYRRHSSGQARVTINGKDHLLGPYGSAASKEAYRRLIAEWAANPAGLVGKAEVEAEPLSINELILGFWKFAQKHYGFEGNPRRGDCYCLRDALRVVRSLYGGTPATDFGPIALKTCRQKMIELDWSRSYVNSQIDRVRRMFRWGAEEEMVPGSVYQALRAVASLRSGKCDARETKKVKPVSQEHVQASMPFMPRVVEAMVRFQQLTAGRPSEVCDVRPIDIDMSNPSCWVYRPGSDTGRHGAHKTAHHGHDRLVLIGPRAQEVLRPYLGTKADAYCFRPADAVTARNIRLRQRRKTSLSGSHIKRRTWQRKVNPSEPRVTTTMHTPIDRLSSGPATERSPLRSRWRAVRGSR